MKNFKNSLWFFSTQCNFKTVLTTLLATLSAQYGISNTTLPTDSADLSRPQIEVITYEPSQENDIPTAKFEINSTINDTITPAQILEKHKITDIKTASLEQLQAVQIELETILKNIPSDDKAQRKPFVLLLWDISDEIDIHIEIQATKNKANEEITKLQNENKVKKQEDQKIQQTIAEMQKKKELLSRWKQQTQTPPPKQ